MPEIANSRDFPFLQRGSLYSRELCGSTKGRPRPYVINASPDVRVCMCSGIPGSVLIMEQAVGREEDDRNEGWCWNSC